MNRCFETTIQDLAVAAIAEAALDEAGRQYDDGKPGAVFCQLLRRDDGTLILKGSFVENEYGRKIQAILSERKAAIQSGTK